MDRKRSREEPSGINLAISKVSAARVSSALVGVVSHDVPEEMFKSLPGYGEALNSKPEKIAFYATGMIIECQSSSAGEYLCTVLAPASLFKRPSSFNLNEIKIDVYGPTKVVYNGKLHALDFHYNLALFHFISNSPLPTVTFKSITDIFSVDPIHAPPPPSFQLRPHSKSFNIIPGTHIISVSRGDLFPPTRLYYGHGYVGSSCPEGFSCNELYEIKDENDQSHYGGPVLNPCGGIIGVVLGTSSFLPSNIVTRWWNHYKLSGELRRPFLGVKVANLRDASVDFLAQFATTFPNISISSGVIVTKVDEDFEACSGIRAYDVIAKLDGKSVNNKLQFFETIWEKTGECVEFNVFRVIDGKELNANFNDLRVTDDKELNADFNGKELNVNFVIQETSPQNFHEWPLPNWNEVI